MIDPASTQNSARVAHEGKGFQSITARTNTWHFVEFALFLIFVGYIVSPLVQGSAIWLDKAVLALVD